MPNEFPSNTNIHNTQRKLTNGSLVCKYLLDKIIAEYLDMILFFQHKRELSIKYELNSYFGLKCFSCQIKMKTYIYLFLSNLISEKLKC